MSRRRPSARPAVPSSVSNCKSVFNSSDLFWWVMLWLMLDVFGDTPTGNQMWPALDQFFARGAPLPLRGSAALGSLRSPSLRLAPEGQRRRNKDNLQKQFYTPLEAAFLLSVSVSMSM